MGHHGSEVESSSARSVLPGRDRIKWSRCWLSVLCLFSKFFSVTMLFSLDGISWRQRTGVLFVLSDGGILWFWANTLECPPCPRHCHAFSFDPHPSRVRWALSSPFMGHLGLERPLWKSRNSPSPEAGFEGNLLKGFHCLANYVSET